MKNMTLGAFAFACALALAVTGACYADTVITFNVSATLEQGTLGGTLPIDETNPGISPLANITARGTGAGPFILSSFPDIPPPDLRQIFILDAASNDLHIFLPISSFTGYLGGPLCSTSAPCVQNAASLISFSDPRILPDFVISGSLTPVPGPVIGSGLPGLILAGGVLLLLARRRRQQTA